MQIIGVSNIKGGVGKTTTAVNLAFLAASTGRRTVLWDLDPQGAATYLLDGEANERASARKLVRGRRGLQEILAPTRFENLALLPADTSYRNFDIHMSAEKHPTRRLMMMARPLQDHCDLLLLDCPPGISLLSENVLRAADAIVVPTLPAPLSLRMLEQLQGFVAAEGWSDLRHPAVLLDGGPAQVAARAGHRRGAEPVPVDPRGRDPLLERDRAHVRQAGTSAGVRPAQPRRGNLRCALEGNRGSLAPVIRKRHGRE